MSESTYAWFLRDATVAQGADVLRSLGLKGLVLPGEGWACVLLPRSERERHRLADLAAQHAGGAVLYDVNDYGRRIWWQRQRFLSLDPADLAPWVEEGLIDAADLPQLERVGAAGIDWRAVLGLPLVDDGLLLRSFVDIEGAEAVGLDIEVAGPPPSPPEDERAFFELLVATGAVALKGPVEEVADGFRARRAAGADAVALIAWLLAHEAVEEVYLSDEGMARALEALPA